MSLKSDQLEIFSVYTKYETYATAYTHTQSELPRSIPWNQNLDVHLRLDSQIEPMFSDLLILYFVHFPRL